MIVVPIPAPEYRIALIRGEDMRPGMVFRNRPDGDWYVLGDVRGESGSYCTTCVAREHHPDTSGGHGWTSISFAPLRLYEVQVRVPA